MPKCRLEIARQVADQLLAAEAAIDAALVSTADLASLMPTARQKASLSTLVGQGALEHAIEAITALGNARRSIIETHKELAIAQEEIGLAEYSMGGLVDKPARALSVHMIPRDRQAA